MEQLYDTLAPDEISGELLPVVQQLGIESNCRELASDGWTIIENVADPDFNDRLRNTILDLGAGRKHGPPPMLLARDAVFAEAVLNPKLMAIAEFSVGRGFLVSQVAASVRGRGAPSIGMHADHNWLPAPFPVHNMLLTACWACDEYSKSAGATFVIPGTSQLRRHPDADEILDFENALTVECPPGSAVLWDGNIWHSNWPRQNEGERVVCHITYSRLMMRPVENYSAHADRLIDEYGEIMVQLLGRNDLLDSPTGANYSKLVETFNNAKR